MDLPDPGSYREFAASFWQQLVQDGFTYVTSQMRYYVAMESLLLPEDMKADLKVDLTDRLVGFYKLIIDFQVQSVIRFYRSRTNNFFRGTISYDGWEKKLQDIKKGDKDLVSKLETVTSGTSLRIPWIGKKKHHHDLQRLHAILRLPAVLARDPGFVRGQPLGFG
jgi:hypothetical protein